jgi:hypothetical protein
MKCFFVTKSRFFALISISYVSGKIDEFRNHKELFEQYKINQYLLLLNELKNYFL